MKFKRFWQINWKTFLKTIILLVFDIVCLSDVIWYINDQMKNKTENEYMTAYYGLLLLILFQLIFYTYKYFKQMIANTKQELYSQKEQKQNEQELLHQDMDASNKQSSENSETDK